MSVRITRNNTPINKMLTQHITSVLTGYTMCYITVFNLVSYNHMCVQVISSFTFSCVLTVNQEFSSYCVSFCKLLCQSVFK